MSAGVAGLQDKLNKSLNQKGMVSRLHFLYHAVVAWCDKFLKGWPTPVIGHINKLLTVGRIEREVWQNGWEERAFCWPSPSWWSGQHPGRSKVQLWVVQFFLETAFAVWVIFMSCIHQVLWSNLHKETLFSIIVICDEIICISEVWAIWFGTV